MHVEPTKVCANPECPKAGERQPWSAFYAKVKHPDGTTRQPQSRCRYCFNRTAAHKRARREYDRRRYAELREDPEARERERARQRIHYRLRRERAGLPERKGRKVPRSERGGDTVSAGPFRDWLLSLEMSHREIAERTGVSPRGLEPILTGRSRRVKLTTVDRACLAMGVAIDSLYDTE